MQRFAPDYSVMLRGTGQRCMVDLEWWPLPVSQDTLVGYLEKRGFITLNIDVVELARTRLGKSKYRRGARYDEAPDALDCSSLIWWVYREKGVELPRYALTQRQVMVDVGVESLADLPRIQRGDVIFTKGYRPYYVVDPSDGVGHVGLLTGEGTVIHAANGHRGVVEDPVEKFIGNWKHFRGVGRVVEQKPSVLTLECPEKHPIKWSTDVLRLALKKLPRLPP